MSLKDFQIVARLGEGAYSSVFKVKRLADGIQYALKKVKLGNLSDKEKQNALNEVRILASVDHRNIVGYKEAFIDQPSNCLHIIMEYADNGDLYQKIVEHQKKGTNFSETEIWSIFIQVTRGLKALHQLRILHRDLKSANVFLTKEGIIKLGDMNVSKVSKGMCETQTGTPYYASPEVWKDQPYDKKSDIWSLGCVLYENITLKPPFRAEDMEGLYKKVIRGVYPRIPSEYSQDMAHIVKMLLNVTPHLRPSCCKKHHNVEKILQLPQILRRLEEVPNTETQNTLSLLNTIRIPKNIRSLTQRLPKPNYTSPPKEKKKKKEGFLPLINSRQDIIIRSLKKDIVSQSRNSVDIGQPVNPLDRLSKHLDIKQIHKSLKKKKKDELLPSLPILKGQELVLSIDSRKKSISDIYNRRYSVPKY